eukprot:CAMPEP_0172367750 /NCGR_PEP_ID=MMETSP1060-20121228/23402_1 /TAXON_ID=37318 /ORGANISM="Pseudo-nitzschia pungens, Strain cf. cingulata" /LENGTH=170 /DNA_ID=CAMNT_0013092101 /DNA_START=57 /DNA_END=569 /DNA_ORIENTATION=+
MVTKVIVVHGGELARDVAEQIEAVQPSGGEFDVKLRCASERPKTLLDYKSDNADDKVVLCFVLQTIENAAPTEEGGSVVRFFKRKTHPSDLLVSANLKYAVLGLGDSNLLLDRQTTAAKDCNQAAEQLDARLASLGGERQCELGMADERTGLTEVEPWIKNVFWKSFADA